MSSDRAKSADFPRTVLPMEFSYQTRSSAIFIDELRRIEKEEQELNRLNNRFATYLHQIIHLGDTNIKLRRQIDEFRQNYTGSIDHQDEYINIRRQLNTEARNFIYIKTQLQRAEYDKKYYKNQLQSISPSDQLLIIHQQSDAYAIELNLLKEQYAKQTEELQLYKRRYNEYIAKLLEYTNEYNRIVSERMQSADNCCTLEEQILFEREYNSRCKEEFEYLEKIEYDLNYQLTTKEFEKIIGEIREDYRKYNEIQISELEVLYEIKFETIKKDFQEEEEEEEEEDIRPLLEENQILEQKLKQLQIDLYQLSEQNQQQYQRLNKEYHRLELRIPEFESSIQISRHNTVYLTSEINTYRCLLANLVQKRKSKPTEFTVHFGNGIIWCRI